jgi:DNA repair ATPase RecN
MDNKEQLVTHIREWVQIDNEIRTLQNELKSRKSRKDGLSKQLIDVMKSNEIDTFDINNGSIEYKQKTTKKPMTKKMLLKTITTYFDGDTEKTAQLTDFINENRETTTKENIVRKVNNA